MASTSDIGYFTFSAANVAAVHLLENIRHEPSPPALISNEDSIGYRLSIPSAQSHSVPPSRDGQFCLSWRIGTGPSPNKVKAGVDSFTPEILLCPQAASPSPSSKAVRASINHIHATIYIHARSRVLMMESRTGRPIIYERGDMNNQDVVIYGGQARGKGLVSCAGGRTFFDSGHIAFFSNLPSALNSKTKSAR